MTVSVNPAGAPELEVGLLWHWARRAGSFYSCIRRCLGKGCDLVEAAESVFEDHLLRTIPFTEGELEVQKNSLE